MAGLINSSSGESKIQRAGKASCPDFLKVNYKASMQCYICLDELSDCLSITYCKHKFHYNCIKSYLDSLYKLSHSRPIQICCPVCRNCNLKKNNLKFYGYHLDSYGKLIMLPRLKNNNSNK